jgi:hypothetical protein
MPARSNNLRLDNGAHAVWLIASNYNGSNLKVRKMSWHLSARSLVAPQALTEPGAVVSAIASYRVLGLGSPSAQPALVIALSERHTPRAQDVVCRDGVEIEVGQRKRKDEGLRREG